MKHPTPSRLPEAGCPPLQLLANEPKEPAFGTQEQALKEMDRLGQELGPRRSISPVMLKMIGIQMCHWLQCKGSNSSLEGNQA